VRSNGVRGSVAIRVGPTVAYSIRMPWRRFTEIEAWKLSMKLSEELQAILDRPPASYDGKFCQATRDAALSAPRNIAEGFGRFGNREFANFVSIARASLMETQTNLLFARSSHFLSNEEFKTLWDLSEEAVATTTGLLKHLRRGKA